MMWLGCRLRRRQRFHHRYWRLKNKLSIKQDQYTPEFEVCVQDVMKQGHEKSSAFAICTKSFKDAGKPLYVGESERQKLHLLSESIHISGNNKVSGVAIHPKRIFHPEEGMTHVYLREELEKAAPTLTGKPFGIDHKYVLPPPNIVTRSWFDAKEGGVAFEGLVDDKIAEQILNKAFRGLSIELDWLKPRGKVEFVDGVAPRNFELTSVHLLRSFPPGDKDAFIKLWNSITEQLVASPPQPLDQRVDVLEKRVDDVYSQLAILKGKLDLIVEQPFVVMKETEWTAETINELPDSAFAAISKGGQKDAQGKTTPRSLRHLPHHRPDDSLDLAHLRNALARLSQTELSAEDRAEAKRHLCVHAKESQIVSEVCGEEPALKESETVVSLRRQLVEAEARLAEVRKELLAKETAWSKKYNRLVEGIKSSVPQARNWKAWPRGPQMLVQQMLAVLYKEGIINRVE